MRDRTKLEAATLYRGAEGDIKEAEVIYATTFGDNEVLRAVVSNPEALALEDVRDLLSMRLLLADELPMGNTSIEAAVDSNFWRDIEERSRPKVAPKSDDFDPADDLEDLEFL